MKIKPLNKKKSERPVGQWIDGRFVADKVKRRGRLPQLSKHRHKHGDSALTCLWKEIDNETH